jgi:hypothetical protein
MFRNDKSDICIFSFCNYVFVGRFQTVTHILLHRRLFNLDNKLAFMPYLYYKSVIRMEYKCHDESKFLPRGSRFFAIRAFFW